MDAKSNLTAELFEDENAKSTIDSIYAIKTIQENNGDAISIFWASEAVAKSLVLYNEIARCNGAALVKVEKTS